MLDQIELLAHSWISYYEQVGRLHWLAPYYQGLLELCSHAAERGKYLHPQNERFLRSLSLVSLGRTYHLAVYLQESLGNSVYLSGFWLEDREINYGLTTSSVFHSNSKVWLYHTWFRQDMIHPLGLGRGPPSLIIFASLADYIFQMFSLNVTLILLLQGVGAMFPSWNLGWPRYDLDGKLYLWLARWGWKRW